MNAAGIQTRRHAIVAELATLDAEEAGLAGKRAEVISRLNALENEAAAPPSVTTIAAARIEQSYSFSPATQLQNTNAAQPQTIP